jgi:rhodanese-related sulfurtransferase
VDTVTDPFSISPAELGALLGRPDAPLVLDVRRAHVFESGTTLLPTAQACAPEAVASWLRERPPGHVVTYCAYGHGVGRQAAADLRAAGWSARWLAGGIHGGEDGVDDPAVVAGWRAASLPRIRKRADLGVTGTAPSRWITRERPKIDRIACPWLIRRFIDRRAQFFYVPAADVVTQAERLGAVPFDVDGAPVSHVWEACTFDALLRAFDLRLPALQRLAAIVRGADTDRLALAPQAAGLLALSLGLSRLHEDDAEMLAAALPLYDALYAWCADDSGERHTWKVHAMADGA